MFDKYNNDIENTGRDIDIIGFDEVVVKDGNNNAKSDDSYLKSKIRNYAVAKWISSGVSIVTLLCGLACLFNGSTKTLEKLALKAELSSLILDVKKSDQYVEYVNSETERLYNDYKSGILSGVEFSKQIENINSDEYVVSKLNEFATNKERLEITSTIEDIADKERVQDEGMVASICSLVCGTLPAGLVAVTIREKEKMMGR